LQHVFGIEGRIDVLNEGGNRWSWTAERQSKRIAPRVHIKGVAEPERQHMGDIDHLARGTPVLRGDPSRSAQPCPPERQLDGSRRSSTPNEHPDETLYRLVYLGSERVVRTVAL
jgi:hypothetical protein